MSFPRQIEVNLDLPSPDAGFAAVGLGDGRFMITSKSLNLTIHNPNLDNSSWAQNSVQVNLQVLEFWQIVDLRACSMLASIFCYRYCLSTYLWKTAAKLILSTC